MIRFNYIVAVLGIVGQIAAVYPRNGVMQDIFFGIFIMGIGMIALARSPRFNEKLGICPEIPRDRAVEKRAMMAEGIVLVIAALVEVVLYFLHVPYTYTTTVIAVIAIVWISRIWRGKLDVTTKS